MRSERKSDEIMGTHGKSTTVFFDLKDLTKLSNILLSDLGVYDIEYIPLENNPKSLIKLIYKMEIDDSCFLINDTYKLMKFTGGGRYITQIGRMGKGMGEYKFCSDFSVDNRNCVYILSVHEDKIYIYSPDGKFLKTIPSPKNTTSIECIEDCILCYSSNHHGMVENSFDVISYNGEVLKSFSNKFKYKAGKFKGLLLNECASFSYDGKIYTKEVYSDTIFVFNKMNFEPAVILDQNCKSLPPGKRQWNSFEEFVSTTPKYISVRKVLKFGEYFYYNFLLQGKGYSFVGSTSRDQWFLSQLQFGLINNIDGGPNIWAKTTKDDNTLVSWINAYDLKAHVASEAFKNSKPQYPEKKKELEKLTNSLDENDNPVLILVKLKE